MLQSLLSQVEEPLGLEVPECTHYNGTEKNIFASIYRSCSETERCEKGQYLSQMNSDTEEVVKAWNLCQKYRPSQARETVLAQEKVFSWSKVCIELFRMTGKHYVLVLDYYSHVSNIALLKDTGAKL